MSSLGPTTVVSVNTWIHSHPGNGLFKIFFFYKAAEVNDKTRGKNKKVGK